MQNEKLVPALCFYGLHMVSGVAEYSEPEVNGGEPYRILISENCLKDMDATFAGKTMYVQHVGEVNSEVIEDEAVGYVVRSFFNKTDGKHWAEFLITGSAGLEAIKRGWKLSNAYLPKQFAAGGKWHNVDFAKEVMVGEYEHLAIVPNPRYEESIILTPEEFKDYNLNKELELERLANSKGDESMKLNFWTKKKLENSTDLENTIVTLKSGTEKSIVQLVNEAEKSEEEKKNAEKEKAEGKVPMANGDHKVKVGESEMTVNELVNKYNEMMEKKNEEGDEKKEDADEDMEVEDADDEAALDKAKNEDEDKKENEEDKKKEEEKKANAKEAAQKKKENFEKLKNAHLKSDSEKVLELSNDKVQRGKARYGS